MLKKISLFLFLMIVPAQAGEILIVLEDKTLTYYADNGEIYVYPVAVPKKGMEWRGVEYVSRKEKWPVWTPTAATRKARPELPARVSGGPNNPLGARALYLGDTLYRIHGTNDPKSIGKYASRGCFRMYNDDVKELFEMVDIGTPVFVQ